MRDFKIFRRNPGSLQNQFSDQIKSHQSREIENIFIYYHKVEMLPKCPCHARFREFPRNPGSLQNHFSDQIKSHQSRGIEKFSVYYHKVAKLPKCLPACELSGFSAQSRKYTKPLLRLYKITPESRN